MFYVARVNMALDYAPHFLHKVCLAREIQSTLHDRFGGERANNARALFEAKQRSRPPWVIEDVQ